MDLIITLIFLGVGFLSFVPVKNLYKYKNEFRYKCLKYLVNAAFVWSWIIIIERMTSTVHPVYYLTLVSYPLKILVSGFMLCTIVNYLGKPLKKWMYYAIGIIALTDLIISVTNDYHMLMLKVTSSVATKMEIWTSAKGIGFYMHAFAAYAILVSGLIYLYITVAKTTNKKIYAEISRAMFYSTVFVVVTSVLQITLNIPYDITYIAMVILVNRLYKVIYQNDMLFNLKTSGRVKILSNMREMYILTDQNENIIEVSHLLIEEFDLNEEEVLTMDVDQLLDMLKNRVVFHQSIQVGKELADIDKRHYHIKKKKFRLEGMEAYGYMILLYDESQVVELLRELNRLSNFDELTGLHNRNFIENLLSEYTVEEYPNIGLLSLDLNGLKTNNDYIGHDRGDFLLKELASIMKTEAPLGSVMARVGGDEFMIVLEHSNQEELESLMNRINKSCFNEDVVKRVSVSIGCALRKGNETIYELLKEADQEMYEAKKSVSRQYSKELMKAINVEGYIR